MNGFGLTSSLIINLYWPVIVAFAIFIFRRPLSELLGRIRSYKGFGQEVAFGEKLATAESTVNQAVRAAEPNGSKAGSPVILPNSLASEAEANPSFVVIKSWEELSSALTGITGAALPGEFNKAASELHDLRNRVAHGQNNPTPGEACAYAESAQRLSVVAKASAGSSAPGQSPQPEPRERLGV